MNKLLYLLLISSFWGCTQSSKTEKYQNKRDNVINVQDRVQEIEIQDILIGQIARLYLISDYLIIGDIKSVDKTVHIFDKNSFIYVTSVAERGIGPGEITTMGHIEADKSNHIFYVSDHGKQRIFSYDLDSVLANPSYMPGVKMIMDEGQFPSIYTYINDTLAIGLIIEPTGTNDFKQSVAKWNMNTGEIKPMSYEHPDIKRKRISFAVSEENDTYVECYSYYDLMTICSLNGDLKYNIYGRRNWNERQKERVNYYGKVIFCNNKIVVTYSGEKDSPQDYFPTKFLVFDINGDYIKTLETGYKICDYCYDKENNRVIMNLDSEIQFAYLELDGLFE